MRVKLSFTPLFLLGLMLAVSGQASPGGNSDPAAEKLWNRCVTKFQKLRRLSADYSQVSFPKDELGDKKGRFDYRRNGKLYWRYDIFNTAEPKTIIMQSDGKNATVTHPSENSVERMKHKDFFPTFLYGFPLGPEFYQPNHFSLRRDGKAPVKFGKDARIGGVKCRVLEVGRTSSYLKQRWYVGPDDVFRGVELIRSETPQRDVTDIRLTNVKFER